MSVFLTPELSPIYGATYLPPNDQLHGGQVAMPGFTTVLRRLSSLWQTHREHLMAKGTSIMSQLQQALEEESSMAARAAPGQGGQEGLRAALGAALRKCAEQLTQRFDGKWGGFSTAGPK